MIILITGGMTTGVGKTSVGASIATLLESGGRKIAVVKFDGVLTLSTVATKKERYQNRPWPGEEIFFIRGKSVDADIGVYYRALVGCKHFVSFWQGDVLFTMLKKEDITLTFNRLVQHYVMVLADVIKKCDILIVEVGGTVGDQEQDYFLVAMKEFVRSDTLFHIHISYIAFGASRKLLKPVKTYINLITNKGLAVDCLIVRGEKPTLQEKERIQRDTHIDKTNIYWLGDMPLERVVSVIRMFPSIKQLFARLHIQPKKTIFEEFENKRKHARSTLKIGLVTDTEGWSCYNSLKEAIRHATVAIDCDVKIIEGRTVKSLPATDGVVIVGARGSSRGVQLVLKRYQLREAYVSRPLRPSRLFLKFAKECKDANNR